MIMFILSIVSSKIIISRTKIYVQMIVIVTVVIIVKKFYQKEMQLNFRIERQLLVTFACMEKTFSIIQ